LVGKRHAIAARHDALPFANHVPELDAGQNTLRRSKRLETEHRAGDAFDGTMVLLDNVSDPPIR
jgi:hypothetical protein